MQIDHDDIDSKINLSKCLIKNDKTARKKQQQQQQHDER